MTAAEKKRREMRETIRDASIREFARNGLAGTSTQAIADAAGITKAQLHYYISSKEELYQEVLRYIVEQWREIFFLAASPEDPATAISRYIEQKLKHALEYPDISRFFAREIARGAPEMSPHWCGLRKAVEEASGVINRWIEGGKIKPVDPLLFQINMWAVTQHYAEYEAQVRVLMNKAADAPLDDGRIIKEATTLFLLRCGLTEEGMVS
ncbi:TetR family transcriptional regulator C-terminal domain-containing protein [Ruegeria marina]|uniref:Transcriptional regulator, TetR family n=1 Tax=Ruegeria marina TaxID=639004 RepID=A0A1G6V107_9RHOB|nr:TetR family transcriptional regulator C-terminal domain-containing protein [Ruegeria marina]SDD47154.1 transcriptional regulator, TetR family [Ruegeria marina]